MTVLRRRQRLKMQMEYVYLLHIYGINNTMAWKVIRERGNSGQIPPSPAERGCVGHTPCTRRNQWTTGVLNGHVCDQDVCKAIWEGSCMVSLVRSWLSIFQGSSYLVWLVTQMVRAWGRVQNGVMQCGQPCGVRRWAEANFPQAWGWFNRHRPEPWAAQ